MANDWSERQTAERGFAVSHWFTNLILTAAVIVTVVMALLLAQLDTLQTRRAGGLPSTPIVLVGVTGVTVEASPTPLPTVALPAATSTPLPPTATATPRADASATAVPVLASCGNVPPGWIPYTVQRGDTLSYLAVHSGATLSEIVQANCLDPNMFLLSGLQLYLPARPPVRVTCGRPPGWEPYVVQPGDTLFSLAQSRGTTLYAVRQANCFTSNTIFYGRVIYLPPLPATPVPTPTQTLPPPTPVPPTDTAVPTETSAPSVTPTATETPVIPSVTPTITNTPLSPTPTIATPTVPITNTPTDTPPTETTEPPTTTPTLEPSTPEVPTDIPTATPPTPTTETATLSDEAGYVGLWGLIRRET